MLGFTPLLSAVWFTNPKCVTVLLEKNANILAKGKKRSLNAALLWAVVVQSPKIIEVCILIIWRIIVISTLAS